MLFWCPVQCAGVSTPAVRVRTPRRRPSPGPALADLLLTTPVELPVVGTVTAGTAALPPVPSARSLSRRSWSGSRRRARGADGARTAPA